jgi:hypothetical protein
MKKPHPKRTKTGSESNASRFFMRADFVPKRRYYGKNATVVKKHETAAQ